MADNAHRTDVKKIHWAYVFPVYCGLAGTNVRVASVQKLWQTKYQSQQPTAGPADL